MELKKRMLIISDKVFFCESETNKINQINFISLSPFIWQHEVKYMVHYRLRRECLTVCSIRLLGGVESYHSASTMDGLLIRRASTKFT